MNVIGQTHIGLVRENNQDALEYGTLDSATQYAVVCDGMGGANGGNIASKIAVEVIGSRIRDGYQAEQGSVERLLESAMNTANIGVYDRAQQQPELIGMGTTVVAVVTSGHKAYVSHVGDSRLYLWRKRTLTAVTRDHSVVQELVERGQITEEEARSHPRKNYITRALGVRDSESGEFDELDLMPGDRLLLCTDGLTNEVSREDIGRLLELPAEAALEGLIRAALNGGGADNITVVLMDID
ncbi:MAG: Stp1/IreP family PP2C-type Ser/Thr phosphatase [Ruminococcaceae bacterium]|nr:Stp1/IreP family PP2C-type Ser/Thr phosphatase [Oscillospiraceae bacterium]